MCVHAWVCTKCSHRDSKFPTIVCVCVCERERERERERESRSLHVGHTERVKVYFTGWSVGSTDRVKLYYCDWRFRIRSDWFWSLDWPASSVSSGLFKHTVLLRKKFFTIWQFYPIKPAVSYFIHKFPRPLNDQHDEKTCFLSSDSLDFIK